MNDPYLVIKLWRARAEKRRAGLVESVVRALPEREYLQTVGAIKELDTQLANMHYLLTNEKDPDAEPTKD